MIGQEAIVARMVSSSGDRKTIVAGLDGDDSKAIVAMLVSLARFIVRPTDPYYQGSFLVKIAH